MADDTININVESPEVEAPVAINFGGLFTGLKETIDGIVGDVRSGSDEAMTGLFLAAMFVVAGIFVWRRV